VGADGATVVYAGASASGATVHRGEAQFVAEELHLRLDTGASLFESEDVYVNVTERVWEELRRLDPSLAPSQYFTGTGTGGEVRLPVARIGSLSVGERTLARPWVIVQPAQGYFARPDAVGFVGNNFLEKFGRVTIDYPGRRLALEPRAP